MTYDRTAERPGTVTMKVYMTLDAILAGKPGLAIRQVDPARGTAVALRVMLWPGVDCVTVAQPGPNPHEDVDFYSREGQA